MPAPSLLGYHPIDVEKARWKASLVSWTLMEYRFIGRPLANSNLRPSLLTAA
ncbi:MAG: hypothetical protein ACPGPS_03285 [Rubripirellula sp.]